MIEVARPGFLWAGALLASLPLLLHFLRPRERARKALPTLRFLSPDPRTRVRLRRRPDELLLLALRMGLCLLLGAAFAGVSWVGSSEGTGIVVVVDGGAGMERVWDAALAAARGGTGWSASRPVELAVVGAGADGLPRVTRFGPDELPDAAAWAALAPGGRQGSALEAGDRGGEVRLAHLIRAVRDGAGRATGVDSLAARIVTLPRWDAWGPGVVELRNDLWPAAIELVVPEGNPGVFAPDGDGPTLAVVESPEEMRAPLEAALRVLGVQPVPQQDAPRPPSLHLRVGPAETLGELWDPDAWEGGADVPSPPPDPRAVAAVDAFLLLDGRVLSGAGAEPMGRPASGAGIPVLRVGGRPAAAAAPGPGGCRLALPLAPEAPILGSGELTLLLESLIARGCGFPGGALPPGSEASWEALRAGAAESWEDFFAGAGTPARARGETLPAALDAWSLRGARAGVPLSRLFVALALGVALLEVLQVRRRGKLRRGSV